MAGDGEVGDRALEAVRKGIARIAGRPDFEAELNEVRLRLERSETGPNFKTGPGGIYDLDYLAGVLQARHQVWLAGNLRDRLQLLHESGLLKAYKFERLADSALFLRTLEHLVRLVIGRARKWLPVADHPRRSVQKLLWRLVGVEESFDPEERLTQILHQTREVYLDHWRRERH
jgi:glutamine synthetase adenylyltransferase